jgi:thioredoxin 1
MDDELEAIRRKKMADIKKGAETNWPTEPVVVTDSDFDGFVTKYPLVVVDCWAPWCGPCRMVAPVVEALAREMTGKVAFAKLNTDENVNVPNRYRISAIPTLLVFKDGKLADRIVGARPKEQLQAELKRHTA